MRNQVSTVKGSTARLDSCLCGLVNVKRVTNITQCDGNSLNITPPVDEDRHKRKTRQTEDINKVNKVILQIK